eukprot:5842104-Pyramimonas_sp.AAC.1
MFITVGVPFFCRSVIGYSVVVVLEAASPAHLPHGGVGPHEHFSKPVGFGGGGVRVHPQGVCRVGANSSARRVVAPCA